jgi:hypothetical protein
MTTLEKFRAEYLNRSRYFLYLTVLLHDNNKNWTSENNAYIWLHNQESTLALYAKRQLLNIDSIADHWNGNYEFLFDPDISMCGNGRFVLCLGMSSQSADLSRLCVDALSAAVGERRISSIGFGEAMALFSKTGVITLARWTRGLRDTARTTPLHAQFVWQAVCTLLEAVDLAPAKQIPFLELLLELQLEHKLKPGDNFEQAMSGTTGGGKCQSLLKTLLAFQPDKDSWIPAAIMDLEAKIQRVERWQRWLHERGAETVSNL